MPGNFLDTNILLSLTSSNSERADRAQEIVDKGGTISIQVLNEIANVARRKMRMSWSEVGVFLETVRSLLTVAPLSLATHEAGVALAQRYGFSIYDAMIVASATLAECDILWSEDMQHGMIVDEQLRIVNPFQDL
jgi:predicted nucleic acid-binding protein